VQSLLDHVHKLLIDGEEAAKIAMPTHFRDEELLSSPEKQLPKVDVAASCRRVGL
jgi:hypothetical protein